MSTLDREPRTNSTRNDALHEPRVSPGAQPIPPSKLPAKIPRGQDRTGAPSRMPVKR